jgi:putative SOS response-associated peptidase YedK
MCGRYSLAVTAIQILDRFHAEIGTDFTPVPHYNIAPSQVQPVIVQGAHGPLLLPMRWGMVPPWWNQKGRALINVRLETLRDKATFADHLLRRRCLVPATGFYEWFGEGEDRMPYHIPLKDRSMFGIAGIWEEDRLPDGRLVPSFSLITEPANDAIAKYHDRMPAILAPSDESVWLGKTTGTTQLFKALSPIAAGALDIFAVSRDVNKPANDRPDLTTPLKPTKKSGRS